MRARVPRKPGPVPATLRCSSRRESGSPDGRVLLGCLDNRLLARLDRTTFFGIDPLNSEACTWCGDHVGPDDGFRAYELAGGRRAVFCRLEHIIPWAIQGSHWGAAGVSESAGTETPPSRCSHCVAQLGEGHVLLVRHRGAHRIADGFCSVTHMRDWAKAGGRWR